MSSVRKLTTPSGGLPTDRPQAQEDTQRRDVSFGNILPSRMHELAIDVPLDSVRSPSKSVVIHGQGGVKRQVYVMFIAALAVGEVVGL